MQAEGGAPAPNFESHTFEIVETQLAIVSTKFSRICTYTVDSYDVPYTMNFTYYHQTNIAARTAEAAALLNRKMNKPLLTVTIGILDSHFNNSRDMRTEVSVALEAAKIANSIYPGTVEAFVLSRQSTGGLDWADATLSWIRTIRNCNTGLKIGTRQRCHDISLTEPEVATLKIVWAVRKAIIQESDFIVCVFQPSDHIAKEGAKHSVEKLRPIILRYRPLIQTINPRIEVMWTTEWNSVGDNSWENIKDFGDYWSGMNKLASENQFPLWLDGAFDAKDEPRGWWKLTKNDLVNKASGYVEKISGKPAELPESMRTLNRAPTLSQEVESTAASGNIFNFNRKLFGVSYYPYVLKAEGGRSVPDFSSHTFEMMQTQLKIVATKFSRIITLHFGSPKELYLRNFTYYYTDTVGTRTAEAAALLNLKMKKKLLTVTFGIHDAVWNNTNDDRTDLRVSIDAVEIANSIYPGTVDAFVLTRQNTSSLEWANSALFWIKALRKTGLKIGTKQYCQDITVKPDDPTQEEIWRVRKTIIEKSDFVICTFAPSDRIAKHGAKYSLLMLRNSLLRYRPFLQTINPRIEVMWNTEWNSDGENRWNNLKNFGDYWSGLNQLASENNFTVWLNNAFDSPLLDDHPRGWWTLTNNALVNNASGYVEKVLGMLVKAPPATTTPSTFSDTEVVPTRIPVVFPELKTNKPIETTSNIISILRTKTETETTEKFDAFPQLITNKPSESTANTISTLSTKKGETTEKVDAQVTSQTTSVPYYFNTDKGEEESGGTIKENWGLEQMIIIILSIALLSVLMYFIWSKYRKSKGFTVLTKRDIDEFKYGLLDADITQDNYSFVNTCALKTPYNGCLEIAKSKLEILYNQVLGGGQFGCVYKAILRNGMEREVAVKMTRHDCLDTAVKGILSEIKILSYLGNHPNIVSIVGAYTTEMANGVVYLVLELCSLGSLKNYLRNFKNQDKAKKNPFTNGIPLGDMIRWSHEIACGMQYLEEKNVIHADLATRNVLLTSDNIAKITDFGLARRLHEYSVYTKHQQEPLPWRWMAIESLKKTEFSIKSDVWSYGVTLWEIFSFGALPFPGRSWNDDFIEELEHESLRLGRPAHATDEMHKIMHRCWELLPEDRPSFVELRAQTKFIYEAKEKHEANLTCNTEDSSLLVSFDTF